MNGVLIGVGLTIILIHVYCCVCVESNSRTKVPPPPPQVAQHGKAHRVLCIRPQCICSVFCVHMYSFAHLIRRTPPSTFSDTVNQQPQLWYHYFPAQSTMGLISWSIGLEKSFNHVLPMGVKPLTSCKKAKPLSTRPGALLNINIVFLFLLLTCVRKIILLVIDFFKGAFTSPYDQFALAHNWELIKLTHPVFNILDENQSLSC